MIASPRAQRTMSPTTVVLLLTLLLGLQPVTTDVYLPALPSLARALGADMGAAQLTLSALIISFGLAQLAWGPISDRVGRRPALLAGLALYGVAAIGAVLAQGVDGLIAWRALQGVGLAAAVTCARSVVRDLYEPREGARVMSHALGGLGMIAMLGPVVGGVLVQSVHWRATLAAVALCGLVVLAAVAFSLRETVAQRNPRATRLADLGANWLRMLRNRTFTAWMALLCASWGGLFTMLAASSFVFIGVLGTSRLAYGGVLASCSAAYVCGTFLCRRLLAQGNASRAVAIGAGFSLTGGVVLVGLSIAGVHEVAAFLPALWLYGIGHGIHQPCGQAGVTGPFPESAGTAASLSGFAMMLTAFLVGLWLGRGLDDTVYPLTFGIGAFSVAVAGVAWTLVRRHGDQRVPPPVALPA